MTSLAATARLAERQPVFTDDHLASLARTYDGVTSPVWVYDRLARCVYRNEAARRIRQAVAARLTFDITDHRDQIVGQLATSSD